METREYTGFKDILGKDILVGDTVQFDDAFRYYFVGKYNDIYIIQNDEFVFYLGEVADMLVKM